MPRTARSIEAGMVDHVLNRGNGLLRLFHNEADYDACERVLVEGLERYPVDLLTYCLMPNHWHVVVRPRTDVALGRLMGWMGVTHVRRHHVHDHRRGAGHLDRGRFKSLPVAEVANHLLPAGKFGWPFSFLVFTPTSSSCGDGARDCHRPSQRRTTCSTRVS